MYCRALQSYHQDYFLLMPHLKVGNYFSSYELEKKVLGFYFTVCSVIAFYKCEYSFSRCSCRLNKPNSFNFYIQNDVV